MASYRIETRAVAAAEWQLGDKEPSYILPTTREAGAIAEAPAELAYQFTPTMAPPPLEPINGGPVLRGTAVNWDEKTLIDSPREGTFIESFDKGAFRQSIANPGVKLAALFQHGQDQLGYRPLGAIQAWESDRGLEFEIATLDVPYAQEIAKGVKAKLFGGASVRFSSVRDRVDRAPGRTASNPRGLEVRRIQQANLREISIVLWPAYSATAVT